MVKEFLKNKTHASTVAQIAVVFQTIITLLMVICLLYSLAPVNAPLEAVSWLLLFDSAFVVAHLSYRAAYSGPRISLSKEQKVVLIVHIVSSLLALCATGFFVLEKLQVSPFALWVVLFTWLISLVSGILFFKKKYQD